MFDWSTQSWAVMLIYAGRRMFRLQGRPGGWRQRVRGMLGMKQHISGLDSLASSRIT